jgi:probable phosphoglycerate mutase
VNVFAIRHGETAWSLNGGAPGTTDLPLTDASAGSLNACGRYSRPKRCELVLLQPAQRATDLQLAGFGRPRAAIDRT